MTILAVNAGSSSLKYALFDDETAREIVAGTLEISAATPDVNAAFESAVRSLPTASGDEVRAIGHRFVHGGERFVESARIDGAVVSGLEEVSELAPLHNPPALAALEAARRRYPALPQVAVFDTAFYSGLPPEGFVYPLPYEWYSDWRIRRFGFHGINHAYCASRAAELILNAPAQLRLVSCHLGNGCSATAIRGERPVATTMGYTPLEGLMMGTRAGSVDPGILLAAQRRRGMTTEELEEILNHRSGLLGVSGVSSDFRAVEAAAYGGHARAALALKIYALRVRAAIGGLAATLGGLDAIVFTAGVGENSAGLRREVCAGLEFLGVRLDDDRNARLRPDGDAAATDGRVRVLVIRAREELSIARETVRVVAGGKGEV